MATSAILVADAAAAASMSLSVPDSSTFVDSLIEMLAPWWVECCFVIFFPIGYYLLNVDFSGSKSTIKSAKKSRSPRNAVASDDLGKNQNEALDAAVDANDGALAFKLWREASVAPSPEAMRHVVGHLATKSPESLLSEVRTHVRKHDAHVRNSKYVLATLDALGHGKYPDLLDRLSDLWRGELGVAMTYQWYEALLGGHSFAGNESRVDELCSEIEGIGQKLTARGFALVIKGFLCKGKLNVALRHIQTMRTQGFYIPPFAVTLLFKSASEVDRVEEVFEVCRESGIPLPEEAIGHIFEDCYKRSNIATAARVEKLVRAANDGSIPNGAFDSLMKVYMSDNDDKGLELWREKVASGWKPSEGTVVGILARCAESKALHLAEEVANHCREKRKMTVAMYSALMKVYAFCGFYDRACGLYDEILGLGLTPDAIMYGCLMRFSVECGRTDLSRELAERCPQLDTQNYMSLIRAAGRDKDVDRAFTLLRKLEVAVPQVDMAVYNCVLDACVCSGDTTRAKEFAADMRSRFGRLDIITYNTLVKGITSAGDVRGSLKMLKDMVADGVMPNDITYNCVVNAAVSQGDFGQAWQIIAKMESEGIKVDHYTLSILLKALKRHQNGREAQKILSLLDHSGIDVCSEEVLLNTLLEVCTHLGERRRLQDLLHLYEASGLRPSLHLYGALIKAASFLKRLDKCKSLWSELTKERFLEPNDIVLGCMMDALVCNHHVSEADELFRAWKNKLGTNMVMISTIVKGYAAEGRSEEAMKLWSECQKEGTALNAVVYNALIDAQARAGKTDEVATLFAAMKQAKIVPDAITYSTMVKSHCVKGDLPEALAVLAEMQRMNLCKDCVVFNTLLDWCTRQHRMDIADQVLQTFEGLNIAPTNFTVGILVKMYGRRRMLEKAFEVADQMPKQWGFKPNAQVCTCLISACFLNGCIDRACQVYQDLKRFGIDGKSCGVFINGLVRAGRVQEAVQCVEEAYGLVEGGARLLPAWSELQSEVMEQLLRVCSSRGLGESVGYPLVSKLRAAGVQVSGRGVSSAVCEEPRATTAYHRSQNRRGSDNSNSSRNWGSLRSSAAASSGSSPHSAK